MIRPASLLAAFVVGWFFPQGSVLRCLIPWQVGVMLFMTFVGLNVHKMTFRRSHFLIVLLNILVGVCGYKLTLMCSGDQELALAVFFTGMAPTATAAPAIAGFLKREVEYVVTGLLLTTFTIVVALPALLPWALNKEMADGEFLNAVLHVAKSVLLTMVAPILIARFTRWVYPKSKEWPKKFKNLVFALWVTMVTIIACRASEFIRDPANDVGASILLHVGLLSLLVCVLNFATGFLIGEPRYREESSQTLGQKNTGAMIVFASLYAGPLVALGPTLYVLWHNIWNAAQLANMARKENRKIIHGVKENVKING